MGFCCCRFCFLGKLRFKQCFCVLLLLSILVCCGVYLIESDSLEKLSFYELKRGKPNPEMIIRTSKKTTVETTYKTILGWTTKSGRKNWMPNTLKHLNCEESRCKVTEDRMKFQESDIVILHAKDVDLEDLPLNNYDNPDSRKLWALLNHEPPPQTFKHVFGYLNFQVDWTISYRLDSTIYAPIYELKPLNNSKFSFKFTNKKRKPATWLVSHCKTSSNREGYVNDLKKFLPVDVFGKCGKKLKSCPKNYDLSLCYGNLSRKYTFYLSFENSLCRDYLTEKVFLALQAGMIPVVFGGADYKNWLPKESYVDALKFKGPQELSTYLNKISKNQTLYNSFFRWKSQYFVVQRRYKWLCDVCKRLHSHEATIDRRKPTQERIDLLEWFYLNSYCKSWQNNSIVHIDI